MSIKPPLIFIVDDVPENIQIAMSHLKELRCDFAYATSGEQALQRIAATKPQLILMDVMMPGMSGGDVAAELRDDPALCQIPLVFLTAAVKREEIGGSTARIAGRLYIAKPLNVREVIGVIEQYLPPPPGGN